MYTTPTFLHKKIQESGRVKKPSDASLVLEGSTFMANEVKIYIVSRKKMLNIKRVCINFLLQNDLMGDFCSCLFHQLSNCVEKKQAHTFTVTHI
jgi:hypothetical protein